MNQPCGCQIVEADRDAPADRRMRPSGWSIVYCPTHAQAPAMLALLQRVDVDPAIPHTPDCPIAPRCHCFVSEARAILRAVADARGD